MEEPICKGDCRGDSRRPKLQEDSRFQVEELQRMARARRGRIKNLHMVWSEVRKKASLAIVTLKER